MGKKGNILIDCSFIEKSWISSTSLVIYATRLIQGFLQYGHYHVHILQWRDAEAIIDVNLDGYNVDKIVLERSDLITSWRPYYKLSGFLPNKLKQEIIKRNITVVINPFHHGTLFFYPQPIRQYAVVHDMFFFDIVKEWRSKCFYYIWHKYQIELMKKNTGLISISMKTHNELQLMEGLDSKIVHNSIPFDTTIVEQSVESVIGKKYILDINRFPESKNAETLIRAIGLIKDAIPHNLYLKGDHDCEDHRKYLERLVAELGLNDRVIFDIDYRTDSEIRYLYSHADLFVSPSLREGFGYTPIEAAIIKTPVLVSEIDVFKEITCGKIPTFDPYSPEDLAKHILEILNNPPSEQERTNLAEFFLDRYSLKKQIMRFEEIIG